MRACQCISTIGYFHSLLLIQPDVRMSMHQYCRVFSFPSVAPSSLMRVCRCIGAGGHFPSLHSLQSNTCVSMHQPRKVLSIPPSLPLALSPWHRCISAGGCFPHFCCSLLSDGVTLMHLYQRVLCRSVPTPSSPTSQCQCISPGSFTSL
jgi:hypothetical protein